MKINFSILLVSFFCIVFTCETKQKTINPSNISNNRGYKQNRIISIEPSVTEILFFLEMDKEVIAVSSYCQRPSAKLKNIKRIGSVINPNIPEILKLQADYIIGVKDRNLKSSVEELKSLHKSKVLMLKINSIDSLFLEMMRLVKLFKLSQSIKTKVKDLRKQSKKIFESINNYKHKKVYIDFSPDKPPFYSMAGKSFLYSILKRSGASLLVSQKSYPAYWLENIIKFNPDIIIAPVYYYKNKRQNTIFRNGIKQFWNRFFKKDKKEFIFIDASFADSPAPSFIKVLKQLKQ